ncbi:MAG: cytochrome c biogenesis protein CcsA [Prevotella sp.]|jgi:ABC-type transport system involved in cytochrome c biogenesis permease subunit
MTTNRNVSRSWLLRSVGFLYILLVITLAVATLVEHYIGTPATHDLIYGSGWFIALWALLVAAGSAWLFFRLRHMPLSLKSVNTLLIHLSFVIILVGAFVTHTTARRGILHLRGDQPTNIYEEMGAGDIGIIKRQLPFYIKLDRFDVSYHDGTDTPEDYVTQFSIIDGPRTLHASVAMNRIYSYHHYRLYQASYDTDNRGSYLSVNHDPWGIGITYAGYLLLFVSLMILLLNPKGTFRRLLRDPLLQKGMMTLVILLLPLLARAAAPTPDRQTAKEFGQLLIRYNGRICPVQSFALDFTQKIYGSHRYHGLSAEQVLMGWMMYPQEWSDESFIYIKSKKMRRELHLQEYASLSSFFLNGDYLLGPLVAAYGQGNHDALHKACADIDSKIEIIMTLRAVRSLFMIPHAAHGSVNWYSPTDSLPSDFSQDERLFAQNVLALLFHQIAVGDTASARRIIGKLGVYQRKNAGTSLPTPTQLKAERMYNAVSIPSLLFMFNLLMGLLVMGAVFRSMRLSHLKRPVRHVRLLVGLFRTLLLLSLLALSLTIVLRGIITGTVPMANGYDTMLLMAWIVMLVMLLCSWRFKGLRLLSLAFGFLLSGFFLLVSHINAMDPAIGYAMPVLNSPLLSIHVSIIMIGFSLLALTFICSVTALLERSQEQVLQLLSRLLLYPAVVALAMGIFIGAVWANISWGSYWTWDPKETWALITFMVYAVALHTQSLPALNRPRTWHWLMVGAFLTLVMTYFGVNYFLEGMHYYA